LIDKKIAGTIDALEAVELADLQQHAEAYFDKTYVTQRQRGTLPDTYIA
jgi:hypothetical protein